MGNEEGVKNNDRKERRRERDGEGRNKEDYERKQQLRVIRDFGRKGMERSREKRKIRKLSITGED